MRYLIVPFFILAAISARAQISHDFQQELKFGEYLINSKQTTDGLFLFKQLEQFKWNKKQRDTLNFIIGKIHFNDKDLIGSSIYLSRINDTSLPYFNEAQLFNSYSSMYLHEFRAADSTLSLVKSADPVVNQLIHLGASGLALLKRDFDSFDEHKSYFSSNYFQVNKQQTSLLGIAEDLKTHKYKSPFLAGLMSVVIPGAGKMYAGKTGQGIAGLLTTGILGLQALEGYRKDGPSSFRFIAFSTVFSFFYIGNIWGSVFTAKTSNDEFNEAVDHKILLDLHIPLRTIFN